MITNNTQKAIVQKRSRRATRLVWGGSKHMTYLKHYCNRAYRRRMREQMNSIVNGNVEADMYDLNPTAAHICSAWDIA